MSIIMQRSEADAKRARPQTQAARCLGTALFSSKYPIPGITSAEPAAYHWIQEVASMSETPLIGSPTTEHGILSNETQGGIRRGHHATTLPRDL
jgi:hypothetical protein